MFGLLSLYPLRFSALEAKYWDNEFVDEEDEARSSSGVLILTLRCEISAALEPDLKQNLSPAGFTLDPQELNTRHKSPPSWKRQTSEGDSLPAQVTRDKIIFWICKIFFWIWGQFLDLQICLRFTNNIFGFNIFIKICNSFSGFDKLFNEDFQKTLRFEIFFGF